MRPIILFLSALLVIAPVSFGGDLSGGEAHAKKSRKARAKKTSRKVTRKQPQKIKLQEAPQATTAEPAPTNAPPPQRGPTRIDFDDRLVQGQTNRSGAVYLYDRKELKTRSMVKKRESFREEIIGAVYETP